MLNHSVGLLLLGGLSVSAAAQQAAVSQQSPATQGTTIKKKVCTVKGEELGSRMRGVKECRIVEVKRDNRSGGTGKQRLTPDDSTPRD